MSAHDASRGPRSSGPNATAKLLSEARKELGTLSRQVLDRKRVFVFRRHGRDESVLISFDYYEELEEARLELERLKAQQSMAGAKESVRLQKQARSNER